MKLECSARKSKRDPTEKELCETICMIKDRFPDCSLDRVIYLLHTNLIREENELLESMNGSRRGSLLSDDDYLSDE